MPLLSALVRTFFFCPKSRTCNDPYQAVRFWVSQMASQADIASQHAESAKESPTCLHQAKLMHLFRKIIQEIPGCILIADGLDERSNSVKSFLVDLKAAVQGTSTHIMITSRAESFIRESLASGDNQVNFQVIKISMADTQSDIAAYCGSVVRERLPGKDKEDQSNVSEAMAGKCQGRFLWVKLLSNVLDSSMIMSELRERINGTPFDMSSIYDNDWRIIMGLPDKQRKRAISLLRCIVFSAHPLTLAELTKASLVDQDDHGGLYMNLNRLLISNDQEHFNRNILELCGSLVEVRAAATSTRLSSTNTSKALSTVHITHFSAKEFLLDIEDVIKKTLS